ncbi:TetR/AcrR family transcriptional regulator [Micromonospora sp. NPDC047707]|uniref:TetR/AcrR family transcriptional regulator n=1 Tax=unclassified Micromonospora TaxID=2617518 RepID=UPI0012B4E2C3|nr:TetR/AcrR family transcriptional regulator [Micromonospora sp. WMMC415]QGN49579.1 TetR family transcriptional regulator [Micromonospora sp. WMMC415]
MTTEKRRAPAGAAVLRDDITAAIRDAVMQELAVVGYARLSIEAVARRAGVSKSAVYRRWSSKLDLVLEIVGSVAGQRFLLPDTGSLTGDLELVFMIMSRALRHPLASQIIPDLLAEAARNPQIGQTLQGALRTYQQAMGERLISRAVARGELAAGVDHSVATDLIVGPLYWRLAVARVPLEPADVPRLAAAVVGALRVAGQLPVPSQSESSLAPQPQ